MSATSIEFTNHLRGPVPRGQGSSFLRDATKNRQNTVAPAVSPARTSAGFTDRPLLPARGAAAASVAGPDADADTDVEADAGAEADVTDGGGTAALEPDAIVIAWLGCVALGTVV